MSSYGKTKPELTTYSQSSSPLRAGVFEKDPEGQKLLLSKRKMAYDPAEGKGEVEKAFQSHFQFQGRDVIFSYRIITEFN